MVDEETIYVETPIFKIEMKLDKTLIQEYGGVEAIQKYLRNKMNAAQDYFIFPHLRREFTLLDLETNKKRQEILGKAEKDLTGKFN